MAYSNLTIMANQTEQIKKNIIENFLIPYYKYTTIHLINSVIYDVKKRSWFPCEYDYNTNVMTFNLGNNISIDIKFLWESRKDNIDMYNLINFE